MYGSHLLTLSVRRRLTIGVLLFSGLARTTLAGEEFARGDLACGPSALLTSALIVDRTVTRSEMSQAFSDRLKGEHSLAELQQAAHALGLTTTIVQLDTSDLRIPKLPLIIAINESSDHAHFVVLYGQSDGHILLLDSPRKPMQIELMQLKRAWDGIGMYVARDEASLQDAGLVPKWKSSLLVGAAGVFVVGIYLAVMSTRKRGSYG